MKVEIVERRENLESLEIKLTAETDEEKGLLDRICCFKMPTLIYHSTGKTNSACFILGEWRSLTPCRD